MARPVWILDTQWREEWGRPFIAKYGLTAVSARKDIRRCLRELSKKRGPLDGLYLVHYSDVAEEQDVLKVLRSLPDVLLFSGGGVGPDLVPRSRIERHLEEFLLLWAKDEDAALSILKKPGTLQKPYLAIEQTRIWLDRSQHDYINLVAPLDLLALAYVGGEVPLEAYLQTRDQLLELRKKQVASMVRGQTSPEFRRTIQAFEESVQAFDDPQRFLRPMLRPEAERFASLIPYPIIHIDDDVDKGWAIAFSALFGSKYRSAASAEKGLDLIGEMASNGNAFVVLLDLGLKWQDSNAPHPSAGLTLLRQIRARYKALPVYAFSAHNDYQIYQSAMEAGASGYMRKISRALSSVPDVVLAEQFRTAFGRIQYDVFRAYLYGAFDSIQEGLKSGALRGPLGSESDPAWRKRRYNLLLLLDQIIDTDFERTTRDKGYADRSLRNLLVALYRPFDREEDTEAIRHNWRLSIVKALRNAAAHPGRGGDAELHDFTIRDTLLVALLVLDPEILDASFIDSARQNVHCAYDAIFTQPDGALLERQLKNAREASSPRSLPLRRIRSELPRNVLRSSDVRSIALMADMVNNPKIRDSALGAYHSQVSPRPDIGIVLPVKDTAAAHALTTASPHQVAPLRRQKGMDYLFCEQDGELYINFGRRHLGQKLDPDDPEQRRFFVWYLDEHVRPNARDYDPQARAFLEQRFGAPVSVNAENDHPGVSKEAHGAGLFELSLFAAGDAPEGEIGRRAIDDLKKVFPNAVISLDRGRASIWFESSGDPKGARVIRGVRIRTRRDSDTQVVYAQLAPTMMKLYYPDRYSEGDSVLVHDAIRKVGRDIALEDAQREHVLAADGHAGGLPHSDARRLVTTAARSLQWLSTDPGVSTTLGESGVFSTHQPHDTRAQLKETLRGIGVAVVAGVPGMEREVSDWTRQLERSGMVRNVSVEEADAIVVVVPEDCDDGVLSAVQKRYRGCGRAWKVVSPDPRYKDWNVLIGLATRLGRQPWTIREREPRTWFLGLDVGHEPGRGSFVAAALVNHQGRLVAWTKGANPTIKANATREEIAATSMRVIAQVLLRADILGRDPSSIRLVIHRDGRTLERVDQMLDILNDVSGVSDVEWLDIDKTGAPLFWLDPDTVPGQYLIFDDAKEGLQMWLRSSAGSERTGMYVRPLCIVPREMLTDLETLGQEVFDLSNAPTQDYAANTKLPITTYFADGFSSTGNKQVGFWGYEHMQQDWAAGGKDSK